MKSVLIMSSFVQLSRLRIQVVNMPTQVLISQLHENKYIKEYYTPNVSHSAAVSPEKKLYQLCHNGLFMSS